MTEEKEKSTYLIRKLEESVEAIGSGPWGGDVWGKVPLVNIHNNEERKREEKLVRDIVSRSKR